MKLNSKSINYNVQTVDELVSLDGLEGDTVVVTDEDRGGVFVYREDNVGTNNEGTIFNGWNRQYDGAVNVKWFGASPSATASVNTTAIQAAIDNFENIFVPNGTYQINSVICTSVVNIAGEGIDTTFFESLIDAGEVLFEINGARSSIQNISFKVETGTDIGTALKLKSYNILIENVRFINFEYGIHAAENFFYHIYKNVFHTNGSSFLADSSSNNDNSFYSCEFQAKFTMTGGYGINFYSCDFSPDTDFGNKPFLFNDFYTISFFGLYMEDGGSATGTFDAFEFKNTSIPVETTVNIHNCFCNLSSKYRYAFVFDNVQGVIHGGTFLGLTGAVAHETGAGSIVFKSTGGNSTKSVYGDNFCIEESGALRYGTLYSNPISNSQNGIALNNRKIELNACDQSTTFAPILTAKTANGGYTKHIEMFSDTTAKASMGIENNSNMWFASEGNINLKVSNGYRLDIRTDAVRPSNDNTVTLGASGNRWTTIYATTGSINTSDAREKTFSDIPEIEMQVAKELKSLVRRFKFNDAIEAKSEDKARIHYGTSAQEVIEVFTKYNLDAFKYGMVCYDEWEEKLEIQDEEGNVTQEYRPAGNRYGIRYEELIMFIIGAL